ncbi:MAG: FtsX-like permease family protein, partial [Sulfurimonas sp.]|nr:FtsX-like permease family protein [Sulfurimonas sp.]
APNGSIDILLNLIFHIDDRLESISYSSFEDIKKFDEISWAVPLSIGGSVKGFNLIGTNSDYFKYYKYSSAKSLEFAKGGNFSGFYDAIIGSEVAKELKLKLGDTIHITHGHAKSGHAHVHANRGFNITAILKPTMTPNDESVFIRLKAKEAIHIEWKSGHFVDMHISSQDLAKMKIVPEKINGILVGLKNRSAILHMEDKINHFKKENLRAIIPAKALAKLYKLMKNLQDVLVLISSMVFIAAIFGMLSTMFSSLNERRREIAILRSLGASVKDIFLLFAIESFLIVVCGIIVGAIVLNLLIFVGIMLLGISVEISYMPSLYELSMLCIMVAVALISSLIPAIKSYKNSLSDGLMVKM